MARIAGPGLPQPGRSGYGHQQTQAAKAVIQAVAAMAASHTQAGKQAQGHLQHQGGQPRRSGQPGPGGQGGPGPVRATSQVVAAMATSRPRRPARP